MLRRLHIPSHVARQPPGFVRCLIPSADNRRCGFVLRLDDDLRPSELQVVLDDKAYAVGDEMSLTRWVFSPDGSKLATLNRITTDGKPYYDIRINGEPAYRSELDVVHRLVWLANDQLAWEGWMKNERSSGQGRSIVYIVKGEDVGSSLEFDTVSTPRGDSMVRVCRDGMLYSIFEDGHHSDPVACSRLADTLHGPREPHEPREQAEEIWFNDKKSVQVSFLGQLGPVFDGLNNSGMRTFIYAKDRSRVGYIGKRYPEAVRRIMAAAGPVVNRVVASGDRSFLATLLAWPAALLCNPYFGPLYIAAEASRRFFPAVNDTAWKKGYNVAFDHFFTPRNELVVTVQDGDVFRLVIDEEEGPLYDEIQHVRVGRHDGHVSYLARSGDDWFRVFVSC